MALLSSDERRQAKQIRNPQRQRQFACGRWLLRVHVAHLLARDPASLKLRTITGSPPDLVDDGGMNLGLSHSGHLCLCVSSTDAVAGCDVEWMRPRPRAKEIAAGYFHADEAAALRSEGLEADFYRLWTLKEATYKARQCGIDGDLRVPAFMLRPKLHCLLAPPGTDWTFATSNLTILAETYSLSVAIPTRVASTSLKTLHYRFGATGVRRESWPAAWRFCEYRGLERA